MYRYIYSIVLCGYGKFLKWLWRCYQAFSIVSFLKNGRKFCCDFGMNICWYWRFVVIVGDWGQIFFLLCVHISGQGIFLLLFLSLWVNIKKPNVEWVEAAVVCSRKVQWKKWQTFFLLLSLCWRLSELVTRAMSEKTCLKINYKIVLHKKN